MDKQVEIDDWIYRIKNVNLLKAVTYLTSVRNACLRQMEIKQTDAGDVYVGTYEMKLLSEGIGALRDVHGSWEKFPFPSYSEIELKEHKASPYTICTYCTILLNYIEKNLSTIDK